MLPRKTRKLKPAEYRMHMVSSHKVRSGCRAARLPNYLRAFEDVFFVIGIMIYNRESGLGFSARTEEVSLALRAALKPSIRLDVSNFCRKPLHSYYYITARLKMSQMWAPSQPIYIVSVNNTPEVARHLVAILIEVWNYCLIVR